MKPTHSEVDFKSPKINTELISPRKRMAMGFKDSKGSNAQPIPTAPKE